MNQNYKNSYKVTEKELVSLSVYNVGFQKCDPLYQWGPGIRDHYLIHYIISGKGYYKIKNTTFTLQILFSSIRTRKYCILRMKPIRGSMHGLVLPEVTPQ